MIPKHFFIVDTETTGFGKTDRVIEVAYTEYLNGEEIAQWSTMLDPEGCPITDGAFAAHGITVGQLAGKPKFIEIAPELCAVLSAGVIVIAHQADFDERMLRQEFEYIGVPMPKAQWLCSVGLARRLLPEMKSHKLQLLAAHFNVEVKSAHRALTDCRTLACVLDHLSQWETRMGTAAVAAQALVTFTPPVATSPVIALDQLPAVPDTGLIRRAMMALEQMQGKANEYLTLAATLTCTSDAEEERISKAILAFKKLESDAVAVRQSFTGELRTQTSTIEAAWRDQILNKLTAEIGKLTLLRQPWAMAKARAADDRRRAAEKEAEAVAMAEFTRVQQAGQTFDQANTIAEAVHEALVEAAIQIAPPPTRTVLGTVTDKLVYDVEIIDAKAVPQAYWSPDLAMIQRTVNAAKGELTIPGVLITQRLETSTRKKRA